MALHQTPKHSVMMGTTVRVTCPASSGKPIQQEQRNKGTSKPYLKAHVRDEDVSIGSHQGHSVKPATQGGHCTLRVMKKCKQTWCLTSTETIRLIRDGEKGEERIWRWGKGEIIYYTVTTRMTLALRWVAMPESHFNVSLIVRDSHNTVSTDHNF